MNRDQGLQKNYNVEIKQMIISRGSEFAEVPSKKIRKDFFGGSAALRA